MVSVLFCLTSFFGVVAVSVDRFLAIHLHLRYQEFVTHKRVVSVVILIWVFSVFISLMIWWVLFDIIRVVIIILGVVALVITAVVYIRIYFAVQRHKNQIHVLQVPQATENNEITNMANVVKSAFDIFYVFLLFLICSFPPFICVAVFQNNRPSILLQMVFLFSWSSVFLNSSLNPVIYCWKMRHIRDAVMNILRNMAWLRNDASH